MCDEQIVTEEGDQLGVNSYWNKRFHKSFKKLPPNECLIDGMVCSSYVISNHNIVLSSQHSIRCTVTATLAH